MALLQLRIAAFKLRCFPRENGLTLKMDVAAEKFKTYIIAQQELT